MKKVQLVLAAALFAVMMICLTGVVGAEEEVLLGSGKCGENLTWKLFERTYYYDSDYLRLEISGTGDMWDYSELNPAPWKDIICNSKSGISELTLEDGITSIGNYAFCGVIQGNSLSFSPEDLILPESLVSIGDYAFAWGSSLGDLTIPNNVISVGNYAFYHFGLRYEGASLTVGNSVKTIGDYAFTGFGIDRYDSPLGGKLTLGDSVISIGEHSFENCGFEGDLIIPDSVMTIGDYAFSGFGSDPFGNHFGGKLCLGDKVTSIGKHAFENCRFIGSEDGLVIPDSVISIGDSAFCGCRGFTGDLTIPDSVTSIGNKAFSYCSFSGNLLIGNSVISIGDSAFERCGFDGTLSIGGKAASIGSSAFSGCSGFTGSLTIPDSVTSIGNSAFSGCSGFTGSLIIPDSVTSVGDSAFAGCGFDGTLSIGDKAESIGSSTFSGCSGFTGSLIIPNSVTSIGDSAFAGCGFDGALTIGDKVSSIGSSAFSGCSGLTGSLSIPDSVTSIGSSAFSDCSGFTGSLTIPDSILTISNSAFSGCSGLTDLTLPGRLTSIGSSAFSGCNGLTAITVPETVSQIQNNAFNNCSSLTSATFDGNAPTMGTDVFGGCADGFTVYCYEKYASSFLTYGGKWNGYPLEILKDEVSPAGGELSLFVGGTYQIECDNPDVAGWISMDQSVASVSDEGLITAVNPGSTVIRAYDADFNTIGGMYTVTVTQPQITGITITRLPKTDYISGQSLDLTGLVVLAAYDNGAEAEIPSSALVLTLENGNPVPDALTAGVHSILVNYGGFTASFNVAVAEKTAVSIVILDDRTEYEVGDSFLGVQVRVNYNDGSNVVIVSGYTVSPETASADTASYTVTFEGLTDTKNITVKEKDQTEDHSFTFYPNEMLGAKVSYTVGETFVPTGFFSYIIQNNEIVGILVINDTASPYVFTEDDISPEGETTTITISFVYQDKVYAAEVTGLTVLPADEIPPVKPGDVNGDNQVDSDDAIYLLRHTLNEARYPINQSGDMNGDGTPDSDDAIYLLRHTLNPERYPLRNGTRQ